MTITSNNFRSKGELTDQQDLRKMNSKKLNNSPVSSDWTVVEARAHASLLSLTLCPSEEMGQKWLHPKLNFDGFVLHKVIIHIRQAFGQRG